MESLRSSGSCSDRSSSPGRLQHCRRTDDSSSVTSERFFALLVKKDSLISLANISHSSSFDSTVLLVPLEDSSSELDHLVCFRRSDVVLDHRGKSKWDRRMYTVLPAALLEGS